MSGEHYLIIGNGPAGREAAITLREKAPQSRVTVISKENVRCYQPHLLPQFIAGQVSEEELFTLPFSFFKERDIKLRLGQCVVDVDFHKSQVTMAHKEIIPYTGLIIAVGGTPRIPERCHRYRDRMLTLKTLTDARMWAEKLQKVSSALIVGGDLTSFALTRTLLAMGKRVSFLLNEESLWPVRCDDQVFREARVKLEQGGVEALRGTIQDIVRRSETSLEVTVDNKTFETGIVGAFYGLRPDVGFLAGSGLTIERGILVDEYLKTEVDNVYAAGDCAQVYHPGLKDYWVSIGYGNAENLGRIAASNLMGEKTPVETPQESILCAEGVRVNTSWWLEF